MSRALITQNIEQAFADHVGEGGAERARYAHWRGLMQTALPRIEKNPVPEAANVIGLASRSDDLPEIESVAAHLAEAFSDLVVVGMGGSSLSASVLAHLRQPGGLNLHVVDNVNPCQLERTTAHLPWTRTAFLVISKSGTTIETLALLAVFLRETKAHGGSIAKQFFFITIPNDNPMHRLAVEHGARVIAHATDMCGRFSILSSVGLIPAAALGVDIRALRAGARIALADNFSANPAAADAAALHMALMEKQKNIHVIMHYRQRLVGLAAWVRQNWSESLGKNGKGTLPVPSIGATDQHSQLQLYLEGPKDKFFTSIIVDMSGYGYPIGFEESADPRLAHLRGHTLGDLSMAEQSSTNASLVAAGRPLRTLICPALDEPSLGALIMHFTLEVVFTAELLGVNAFDQPAVETGKRFALEYLAGKHRVTE